MGHPRRSFMLQVYGYVVMPEHVHLLLSEPQQDTSSDRTAPLKPKPGLSGPPVHTRASKTPARDGPFVSTRRELREQKTRPSGCYSRAAEDDFCQRAVNARRSLRRVPLSRPPSLAPHSWLSLTSGLLVQWGYFSPLEDGCLPDGVPIT